MKFAINLFCLFAFTHTHATALIRFQAQVSPGAQYVGDVLRINPDKKHWSKIRLDSHPREEEHLSQQQIMDWLQHQVGVFDYQWQGKRTLIVKSIRKSTGTELLNKAQTALNKHLQGQAYTKVLLTSKSKLKDSDIAIADFKVQLPKEYPIAKRVCVRLTYKKRSIPVWFAVKAYQSVWVAQHQLKQHSLVTSKDFALEKRDISGLKHIPLTQLPKTVWLTQTLNKHQIATQNDLSAPPEVIQGQTVKVNVMEHGITIITEASAQSNGYKGQVIRMRNLHSNKYFFATVTGINQAEIAA